MKRNIIIILSLITITLAYGVLAAENMIHHKDSPAMLRDSVMINFRQSKWDLDPEVGENASALEKIDRRVTTVFKDSVYSLKRVRIYGGASPEGSVEFNRSLSEHRAETLFGWFDKYNRLSEVDKTFIFYGRDWEGVLRAAEKNPNIPYKDETVELLRTIVSEKRAAGGKEPARSLQRIQHLRGGEPYQYLYRNIFPEVRASKVVIDYERVPAPEVQRKNSSAIVKRDTVYVERIVEVRDTVYVDTCNKGKK